MNMTVLVFFLIKLIEYMFNEVLNTFICNLPQKTALRGFADFNTYMWPTVPTNTNDSLTFYLRKNTTNNIVICALHISLKVF